MIVHIAISDLFKLREAALALKQRNYIWYDDILLGNDDPSSYVIYTKLPIEMNKPLRGLSFNTKELSKVCSQISIEPDMIFNNVPEYGFGNIPISIQNNQMIFGINPQNDNECMKLLQVIHNVNGSMMNIQESDVTELFLPLALAVKSDGSLKININNHIMFIPSNAIPMGKKNDKLFMTMIDNPNNTFTVRFRLVKKKYNIIEYMSFLRL